MSYEPTKLDGFKKTIKITDMPDTARKFDNGDRCMAREYVKGKPMFGYYTPNGKGDYTFERTFWMGRAARGYNWCKAQPGFVAKQPSKSKPKPAPKVLETMDGPIAVKTPPKPKSPSRVTKADLQNQLDDMSIRFEAAVKMLNDLGYGVK